ncbi:MAG: hypothetical protein ACPGQ5_10020 [Alphaproteobacteria bacterium]|jgi:hypothetical protein
MTSQELDEVRPVRRRRAWYKRRDVLFVIVVALIWIGWEGYGRVTGPDRITDELAVALDGEADSFDLLVTAKFPPERFHSNVYNEVGVQRGTEGATTKLVRVRPSGVRWLSRQYWIEEIDLAPPSGR